MRFHNIASLWSASPPSHRVTSALSLSNPPSLYTGASDGAIVWWKLPGNPIPFALLCGHASAISALSACSPLADALLSACSDGVLCVWSRESGHCRRRRKLPPWAGSPAGASALPGSPRYVCVTCVAPAGDGEGDEQLRKCPRLAVLVIDSCGLNVVQTIAHEPMPLGPLKCVRVITEFGDAEGDAVVLADAWGNTEVVGIQKENEGDVDTGKGVRRSVSAGVAGESSERGGEAVCVDVNETLLAVVFETHCTFKTVVNGLVVGEICLKDTPFFREDRAADAQLTGCVFLQSEGMPGGALMRFVLWSTSGAAAVYEVKSISDNEFLFELICEIPISLEKFGSRSVIFCELQSTLLRVQSCCSSEGNSSTWRPFVTIWSVPDLPVSNPDPGGMEVGLAVSRMIGDGGFSAGWSNHNLSSVEHLDGRQYLGSAEDGVGSSAESHATNFKDGSTKAEKCNRQLMKHEHVVTSSMVLSEDSFAPYAVVYGFDNGDIEVTWFWNSFADLGCPSESATKHAGSSATKESFLGHKDGVVCLAAHHMVSKSSENHLGMALVSGSLDCTVRVWDMDNGNLVSVLHHHVAPVRQIVLAPPSTFRPWSDCFLSVGEDGCVALISLETLKVERMFPGHPSYPSKVVWDSARGYIACLCTNVATFPDPATTLCIWDVKTGARERVLRGAASHAMFDHFCGGIKVNELTGNVLGGTTSASLLHLPVIEDTNLSSNISTMKGKDKYVASGDDQNRSHIATIGSHPSRRLTLQHHYKTRIPAVKCSCPFPGIAILKFDLASILSIRQTCEFSRSGTDKQVNTSKLDHEAGKLDYHFPPQTSHDACAKQDANIPIAKESLEGDLIRFSLAFLHLWDVDQTLDALLRDEMNIVRPEGLCVASGVPGDKGSLMITLPGLDSTLELWKSSAEFSAMRSLTMVSLAQRLLTLSHASSTASSALAAFYTRNFAEKVPSIKPPLLQILVSFWQDPSEHVRMAARSLFHCAAPRAVPSPIYSNKIIRPKSPSIPVHIDDDYAHYGTSGDSSSNDGDSNTSTESGIVAWLESYETHDWISCIGGTPQDAMASHIVVAAALSVWYPSIVKSKLAEIVSNHLIKLVMVANERYSSTAAELLSEGMDSTWKPFISSDIPRLIGDIFFQIECLSGSSARYSKHPALAINFQEALTGILLPSLAMADVPGFLHVIESQIWATSSDSPVHLVSLKALIRVIRGSPKLLTPYLDKVVNFILQTMDPANPAMRKVCLQSSTAALKEVARGFPMVAVNEPFSRLAVGDAVGDINNVTIRIYDLKSLSKIKVLDASGPPGLSILSGTTDATVTTAISVLSFSPDGEGLVAFSEQGLVIRWWSLGSAWWEKLGRNLVPTQCTKLIFVPPWEGFSPNCSRSSIIASIISLDNQTKLQEKKKESNDDSMKASLHNLDLSYRLEWVEGKKVALTRFGRELGLFQF